MMRTVFLLFLTVAGLVGAQNIDITQPIVRGAPSDISSHSYFGFNVLLHRISPNPSSFQDYVNSARIIVSAPNGTAPSSPVERTGLLYTCGIQPGVCQHLRGDGNGADLRLYDEQPNPMSGGATTENKTNQYLGISMDSRNNHFIVCAHRYLDQGSSGTERLPRGRCYYTRNNDLTDFQELALCSSGNFNFCQLGTSVVFAQSNGNIDIGMGAPGSYGWRGALFRRGFDTSVNTMASGEGTVRDGWQGYAITKGRIVSQTREDFITSVPRGNTYFGQVNVVSNDPDLDIIDSDLNGDQFGEYYGFSLATADLTGDGFDEILVGAPMYSPSSTVAETGRVYVYRNTGGSLSFLKYLTGESEGFARFGHAISNLGDINGDGLHDIAISAPFGTGSGKVYIYYGSSTGVITDDPVQIINGTDVTANLSNVPNPSGFGASLSSLIDVDGNGVNDLAIGAMHSQQVFLLRSRLVADVSITLRTNPSVVQTTSDSNTTCILNSNTYPCFNITVCATYPDRATLPSTLDLTFTLVVDRRNSDLGLEQRVFFNNVGRTTTYTVTEEFSRNQEKCIMQTAYIFSTINDLFNGFPVDVSVSGPQLMPVSNDGNFTVSDITNFPFVSTSGVTQLSVEQFRDCAGQTCIPDLQLSYLNVTFETSEGIDRTITDTLTAGSVTNLNVWIRLRNALDNAYLTQLTFTFETLKLEFVRIEPRSLLISCTSQVQGSLTKYSCLIANPLSKNESRVIAVRLRPSTGLDGSERSLQLNFNSTSINPENPNTLSNNNFTLTLTVLAQADVHLDQAVSSPEQVSYMNINSTSVTNISRVNDLGPQISVRFVVRNAGPTTIPSTQLSIFWPYRPADSLYYYAYPSTIMVSSASTVTCNNTFINPENFGGPIDTGDGSDNEQNVENRRRKRWVGRSRRAIEARQAGSGGTNEPVVEIRDINVNCRTSSECVQIVCTIKQLPRDGRAEVNVISYLDERHFSNRVDRFAFTTYATVTIIDSPFIVQPNNHLSDETAAEFRAVTTTPPPRRSETNFPPWLIALIIILSVIIIIIFIVIGVILYFVGFFKRKGKQKKEEISAQILAEQQGGEAPL